jgi:hypothetical protein
VWGFRIEWEEVGDIQPFASDVLSRHVGPTLTLDEDDVKHVCVIATTPPGLLSREAALLLAHQLAAEIRSKVNEYRGSSSPRLPEPSIKAFQIGPESGADWQRKADEID